VAPNHLNRCVRREHVSLLVPKAPPPPRERFLWGVVRPNPLSVEWVYACWGV
jgi:hypothetical protein